MFKLLRKYNKILLAFFGVLLMITFLIPQAFDSFSQQAGMRRGTVATVGDGEKISALQWDRYLRELRVLERITGSLTLPGLGEIEGPQHWYLLVREAEAAGVVPAMPPLDAGSVEVRNMMLATDERDPEIIVSAQANYAGVLQLLNLYSTGDLYSDRRLRSEAERLLHLVTARMVVVKPDPTKSDLQPTEEQIKAQLDKYADKLPGEGEFGFGYKLPHRVKLEWLKIPAASVRAVVESSDAMDSVQQRMHWKRNPNKAAFPAYPADGSGAAIPDIVRSDLLTQLTKTKMEEIAKFASDTLSLSLRGLPEQDGYRILPADWSAKQKALPQLAEELRARYQIALPEYAARGDSWLKLDELAALPGIGSATTDQLGATPVAFTTLVTAAKELGGNTTIMVQKGVVGPPLKDAEDNIYFFRITDADASRVPASVDEVRQQVIDDLKSQADYERVKSSLASIESSAKDAGLLRVALEHDTIIQPPGGVYLWSEYMVQIMNQYRMPLTFNPSPLPVLGDDRKTTEAIIDRALALPQDKSVDQLPEADRVFAIASDDKLAVVVVEVMAQQPLSRESFNRLASVGAVQQIVAIDEAAEERSIQKAFAFDVLAKRNGFEMQQDEEAEENAAEPTKTASIN